MDSIKKVAIDNIRIITTVCVISLITLLIGVGVVLLLTQNTKNSTNNNSSNSTVITTSLVSPTTTSSITINPTDIDTTTVSIQRSTTLTQSTNILHNDNNWSITYADSLIIRGYAAENINADPISATNVHLNKPDAFNGSTVAREYMDLSYFDSYANKTDIQNSLDASNHFFTLSSEQTVISKGDYLLNSYLKAYQITYKENYPGFPQGRIVQIIFLKHPTKDIIMEFQAFEKSETDTFANLANQAVKTFVFN